MRPGTVEPPALADMDTRPVKFRIEVGDDGRERAVPYYDERAVMRLRRIEPTRPPTLDEMLEHPDATLTQAVVVYLLFILPVCIGATILGAVFFPFVETYDGDPVLVSRLAGKRRAK